MPCCRNQQALLRLNASGIDYAPYLRTSDQYEIDLLLDFGTKRWACEIKLTADPKSDDLARLNKVADPDRRRQTIPHIPDHRPHRGRG